MCYCVSGLAFLNCDYNFDFTRNIGVFYEIWSVLNWELWFEKKKKIETSVLMTCILNNLKLKIDWNFFSAPILSSNNVNNITFTPWHTKISITLMALCLACVKYEVDPSSFWMCKIWCRHFFKVNTERNKPRTKSWRRRKSSFSPKPFALQ